MKRLVPVAMLVLASCSPGPDHAETGADPGAAGKGASRVPPSAARTIPPTVAASQQPKLAVDGEGLRWFLPPHGSARPLAFGMPEAEVLASLERVRGPAGKGVNQDCGAGPVQYATWPDGLSLVFQNGEFAGWGLDRRASGVLATANGVGPGTTRSALEDSFGSVTFQNTSVGSEFAAGDIFGRLDGAGPEATITDMWAGVSCVAR